MNREILLIAAGLTLAVSLANPVHAAPFEVSGSLSALTSYDLRGKQLSDGGPSAQGDIEIQHSATGLYLDATATSVSSSLLDNADAEVDATLGWDKSFGHVEFDSGAQYVTYPGALKDAKLTHVELFTSAKLQLGGTGAKVGFSYTPQFGHSAQAGNYVYGELSQKLAHTPFTLKAHVGRTTDVGGKQFDYVDYRAGVDTRWKHLILGVAYVATDATSVQIANKAHRNQNKLVGSLTWVF